MAKVEELKGPRAQHNAHVSHVSYEAMKLMSLAVCFPSGLTTLGHQLRRPKCGVTLLPNSRATKKELSLRGWTPRDLGPSLTQPLECIDGCQAPLWMESPRDSGGVSHISKPHTHNNYPATRHPQY